MEIIKQKVIVLYGGRSAEHEVSVNSAVSVLDAIDTERYISIPVGITKSGRWVGGLDPREIIAAHRTHVPEPDIDEGIGPIARILSQGDVVFPVMHGPLGEDGSIQGLLEIVDKPYVGAGVVSSALGMDKVFHKTIYRARNIPVVDFHWINDFEYEKNPEAFHQEIATIIGFPCFVKPANMGSSVGINKVKSESELPWAIAQSLKYDRKVLIEKAVIAREIECSVMGNEEPAASLPGEIVPNADFYDYTAKYEQPSTLHIPAVLTPQQIVQIQDLAKKAYKAIDCVGLARVDFFLLNTGTIYVNEINTMPGFTQISMYAKMWAATGLSYKDLISNLISLAFCEYEQKRRISVSYRE